MRNFDFSDMGPDNQVLFFKRAYKLRSDFWLDRLDCSVSFHRQKVEGGDALSKRFHGLELPLMTISLRTITRIGRSCWFLRRLRNIRRKCLRLLHLGLRKFGNMGDSCGYS